MARSASARRAESVSSTQQRCRPRKLCNRHQRPCPPDASSQKKNSVSPDERLAVRSDDAQSGKQFRPGLAETVGHPWRLQRGQIKPASCANVFSQASKAATGRASAVVKEPPLEPRRIWYFCNFCI